MSFPEARNRAITDALASDSRTILIGDLGGPGEPEGGYAKAFGPKRAREGPVSEESLGGAAVGAALMGLRPIVTFANAGFMFDAWEPVMDEAAFMRYMSGGQFSVPAVFHVMVGIRTGWAAQHAQVPHAMFCNAPGLVVVAPGTPAAAYELMRAAAASDDPVIYVDPRPLHSDVGEVQANGEVRPVRAKVLRPGNDITVVAVSTAHGYSQGVGETVKTLRDAFARLPIIAGNVTSAAGVEYLADCGADAIKVGQGPGSICTTRIWSSGTSPVAEMECSW